MVKKSSTVQPSQNAGTNVGGKEAKPPAVSSKSKANGDAPMKSAPGGTEQTSTATTETQIVGSAGGTYRYYYIYSQCIVLLCYDVSSSFFYIYISIWYMFIII